MQYKEYYTHEHPYLYEPAEYHFHWQAYEPCQNPVVQNASVHKTIHSDL